MIVSSPWDSSLREKRGSRKKLEMFARHLMPYQSTMRSNAILQARRLYLATIPAQLPIHGQVEDAVPEKTEEDAEFRLTPSFAQSVPRKECRVERLTSANGSSSKEEEGWVFV